MASAASTRRRTPAPPAAPARRCCAAEDVVRVVAEADEERCVVRNNGSNWPGCTAASLAPLPAQDEGDALGRLCSRVIVALRRKAQAVMGNSRLRPPPTHL